MSEKKPKGRDYPLAETPNPKPIKDTLPQRTMMDLANIYTGDAKSNPGVLKAKSDKKKSDIAVANYKSKMDKLKSEAILKVKTQRGKY